MGTLIESPVDDLDRPESMIHALGTFWSHALPEEMRESLSALVAARLGFAQTMQNRIDHQTDSLSRLRVSTYLEITQELLTPTYEAIEDRYTAGLNPEIHFLRTAVPQGIVEIGWIEDEANEIFVIGSDCLLHDGYLLFSAKPQGVLKLCQVRRESSAIFQQFGSLLQLQESPKLPYLDFLNVLFDALLFGVRKSHIGLAAAAIFDVPVAKCDQLITHVLTQGERTWVVANLQTVRIPYGSTVRVTAGDFIKTGEFYCDTVAVYPSHLPPDLPELVVPATLLDASLVGPLTFENSLQTTTVTENVSGYTKLTWPMPDDPSAVTAFFDLMHARGVTAEKTLANYLDLRPSPTTQPTAASLPTQINPYELLLKSIWRNHATLVVVKTSQAGERGIGIQGLNWLRDCLPVEHNLFWILQ